MIQRVKIQGYKSLRDVQIYLQPLTVIFGPNAAGKSNLFDALALLSRIVQGQSLNQAFEQHRGYPVESFYYGDSSLSELRERVHVRFQIQVDVALSARLVERVERSIREHLGQDAPGFQNRITTRNLRYELCVQMSSHTTRLSIMEESLVAVDKEGQRIKTIEPFISTSSNRISARSEDPGSQAIIVPIGEERVLAGLTVYSPAYPHITALQADVRTWQFHYLEPKRLMREETVIKNVNVLDTYGADLAAFYYILKAQNPRQFDAINRALSSLLPRLTVDVEATGEGRLELKIREGRTTFSIRTISEGTLRLLGVLAALNPLSAVSTVGLEEPENGVHPRRLAWIAEMVRNVVQLRDLQMLLTTHSPALPDFFDESNLVICRKEGSETVFESFVPRYSLEPIPAGEDEWETTFTERVLRGDFGG